MRRLMTGYAVTFNKRHRRSGHLFQNRYKSVICEEDPYLLELIRYIHLNPLRAKLVQDLKELDKYPWTGHSTILGHRKNPLIPEVSPPVSTSCSPARPKGLARSDFASLLENQNKPAKNPIAPFASSRFKDKLLAEKTIEDVLLHFGETIRIARRRYRQFVKNGIDQGKRPEFQGGGLVRSAGGNKAGLLGRKKEEREKGDSRILGSGDFVNETLIQSETLLEKKYLPKRPIEELVEIVAGKLGLKPGLICSGSRKPRISDARSIIAHMAVEETGHSATDVARHLGIKQTSVLQSVKKGRILSAGFGQDG